MTGSTVKQFTCFVASPGDVQAERDACETIIQEINRVIANNHIALRLLRWEKDACPAVGADGQTVINDQLFPEKADFFIGIFWSRFGSPTPRAGSGTEEEFNLAFEQWTQTKSNRILFFFKTEPIPQPIDPDQIRSIDQFKKSLSAKGCFYKEFKTAEEFSNILRETLMKELLQEIARADTQQKESEIHRQLAEKQKTALSVFQEEIQWIDQYICERNRLPKTLADLESKAVSIDTIVDSSDSFVISAPHQFGLSAAAHHLRLLAWEKGQAWGYVDMDQLPPLSEIVTLDLQFFHRERLDCIIVDSWNPQKTSSAKVFEVIESVMPSVRIIVMHTRSESGFVKEPQIRLNRDWKERELLPMPRQSVRKAVASHCLLVPGDEDSVLKKLLGDLESMNIPRTPINCWSILKASEARSETSPVNRTELFDLLLCVLFNRFNPPTYGTLPDTKDCNRFLGSFCERLIRETKNVFSKREFIKHCSDYCDRQLIDVDVAVVFDILVSNRIIIQLTPSDFRFSASFWIYYFGAKQMEQSDEFKQYVLENNRYANYPEIIEFYTGSTRDKTDILTLLDADLAKTQETMNSKLSFPNGFNPLKRLSWTSSPRDIQRMKDHINDGVSGLPPCLRDQYADKNYNYFRPYDQSIQQYIEDASFFRFIQQIKALSRALRNSDYADSEIRIAVVRHIISGWVEIAKVLFALTPFLAQWGRATWEGFGFYLDETFDKDRPNLDRLFIKILQANPHTVVRLVRDDLSSQRIGKLLGTILDSNLGEFPKHLLMIYLVFERPPRWNMRIRTYIHSLSGKSFYLADILNALGFVLQYDFPSEQDRVDALSLAKECLSKHESIPVSQIPSERIYREEDEDKSGELG